MKKFLVVTVLVSGLLSCQESKDNNMQKLPKRYDKSVGEQIPVDVAYRWIRNFNKITMAGRVSNAYSINAATLASTIGNVKGRLGVVLHHGLDDSGEHHLFMFAIDEDGVLFKNQIVDVANGGIVEEAIAKSWSNKYALEHPSTPWYHFFGSDVFSEIQSASNFSHIDIVRGLNENNAEQILLFVYKTEATSGRSQGESMIVYDLANPCPPCSTN